MALNDSLTSPFTGGGTVTIIGEDGTEQTQRIQSDTFQIETENVVYEPAIVEEIEWENDGKQQQTSDQCGNTKRARTRQQNRTVTIRGIATDNQRQTGTAENGKEVRNMTASNIANNLGTQATSSQFGAQSDVQMVSSLYTGSIMIGNTVARQVSDLISIDVGVGEELAYRFQIQLGATDG